MGGGDVSSAKLRPIHPHHTKGADKADKAEKAKHTEAPKPPAHHHAGSKDDFQSASKAQAPLGEGNFGVSHVAAGLRSQHGAIGADAWADPAKLMKNLTQYPHEKRDAQSEAACGAANVLGAAMLSGGPDAAAQAIHNAANAPSSTLTDKEKSQLNEIADKVKGHTATYEDLNKAQVLMYRSAHTKISAGNAVGMALDSKKLTAKDKKDLQQALDNINTPSSGMALHDDDQATIERLVGKAFGGGPVHIDGDGYMAVPSKRHTTDVSGLGDDELRGLAGSTASQATVGPGFMDQVKGLAPGQALTVRVGAKDHEADADHFVTVGRRQDGTFYIYNPDPGHGDSTLSLGKSVSGKFEEQLEKYELRQARDPNGNFPPGTLYKP